MLGYKKHTRGYLRAVNDFHRRGVPLPSRMRKPLAKEVEHAKAEIGRIEAAIAGSAKR